MSSYTVQNHLGQNDVSCSGPSEQRVSLLPGETGMWFFVIGDLLIFAVYFVVYGVYRQQNLPVFLRSQQHLDQNIAVFNTLVLLTSSLLVALAVEAARQRKRQRSVHFMSAALVCGGLFPLLKIVEWIPKLLAGHTAGENLFFTFYYLLTGLHLLHVVIGLCLLGFMLVNLRRAVEPDLQFIETGGIYWHMVDVLWLVLLAVFYLMR